MYGDSWASVGRRRAAAFAATFAGVFLLGGTLLAVTFFESHRKPAEVAVPTPPPADERRAFEMEYRAARDCTAAARRQADAAELALFVFLNSRFTDEVETATRTPRPADTRATQAAPLGPTIRPNPQWVELSRQLSVMQQDRAKLLEKLTPAHPTVQSLDDQMAKLRDQLAATPAELPMDPQEIAKAAASQNPPGRDAATDAAAADSPAASPPSTEVQQHYRDLLLAAGHARDAYRAAVESETAAWNAFRRGRPSQIVSDASGSIDLRPNEPTAAPPATGESAPAEPAFPIGAIAILTLLSILAGVFAACRGEKRNLTFMSAEEIEATLGLPVLGRLGPGAKRQSDHAA